MCFGSPVTPGNHSWASLISVQVYSRKPQEGDQEATSSSTYWCHQCLHTALPLKSQHQHSSDACHPHSNCMPRQGQVLWDVGPSPKHTIFTFPKGTRFNNWVNATRSWASCWMNWRVLRSSVASRNTLLRALLQWAQTMFCSASALAGRRCPLTMPCTPKRSADLLAGAEELHHQILERTRKTWEKDSEAPGTDEREVKVILGRSPCDFHD